MALSFITLTKRLRSDAAASYKRARAAGMPSTRLESAWRSEATQQKLYEAYRDYVNCVGPYANYALRPDLSNHVKGIAVDSHGSQQEWLRARGVQYGWTQDANEPWHFDYDRNNDAVLGVLIRRAARRKIAADRVAVIKKTLGIRGWYGPRRNRLAAQRLLHTFGYYKGRIDGVYGPLNKRAWASLKADAN